MEYFFIIILINIIIYDVIFSSCEEEVTQLEDTGINQVLVSEGILEGEEVDNEYGGKFYSFKGIPYAEPPVGDLRFKAPQPLKSWDGVRDAKEFQSVCAQLDSTTLETKGSEDCLYLNVYTPEIYPEQPFPVMFYIYGSGFITGSANDDVYGPEFLVKEDVILVTLNYRLGALGYLCLDTENVPGNAGMKDQVAALKWIYINIKNFGGDPENITIFGQSSGGASVAFHLLSPMSKGIFKRGIAQSGVSTCWLGNTFQARRRAITLAKRLGFDSEDNEALYDFFKSHPVENLLGTSLPITYDEASKESFQSFFGIVNETQFGDNERFFYGDVFERVRANLPNTVEVMVGYTEDEGYIDINVSRDLPKMLVQANQYLEYFVPPPIVINAPLNDQLEVGRKIKEFYFKNENITMNNLSQLVKYSSSNLFVFWIIEWAKTYASNIDNKIYLYKFTAKTERNIAHRMFGLDEIIGNKTVASHADENAYLFPFRTINPKMNTSSNVFKLTESIVKLWTNFAKFGNPTPDNELKVNWAPYTAEKQDYLEIGNEFLEKNTPEEEEIQFLENIFKTYLPEYLDC